MRSGGKQLLPGDCVLICMQIYMCPHTHTQTQALVRPWHLCEWYMGPTWSLLQLRPCIYVIVEGQMYTTTVQQSESRCLKHTHTFRVKCLCRHMLTYLISSKTHSMKTHSIDTWLKGSTSCFLSNTWRRSFFIWIWHQRKTAIFHEKILLIRSAGPQTPNHSLEVDKPATMSTKEVPPFYSPHYLQHSLYIQWWRLIMHYPNE